ncbi:murein transglycosylase domain-containing protein [Galenea microaerophila]
MSAQRFFYSLLAAMALLMAFSIGMMGTAAVLQKKASLSPPSYLEPMEALSQTTHFEPKMVNSEAEQTGTIRLPKSHLKFEKNTQIQAKSESQPLQKATDLHTTTPHLQPSQLQQVKQSKQASAVFPHYEIDGGVLKLYLPKQAVSYQTVKRALTRLLLSDQLLPASELLSTQSFSTRKVPFFYDKVLDQQQQPMRYPADVYRFVNYVLTHPDQYLQEGLQSLTIALPLKPHAISEPVHKYQQWVARYAKQFSVKPALVFAIMETESGFNPKAVSRSQALGLMQLKPHAAGQDVYQYIDLKRGKPSAEKLFDAENNIRMGTAYIGLLQNEYLAQVRNKLSKKILAIAAYNGGLSTVLKVFGNTKAQAIQNINRLNPKQIYRKLRLQHQSAETRAYIDKVLKAELKYQKILS